MEWISVNDDLPEEGLVVVICGANFGVSLGSLDTDVWVATGLTPKGPITHWMPLPNPPEDKD